MSWGKQQHTNIAQQQLENILDSEQVITPPPPHTPTKSYWVNNNQYFFLCVCAHSMHTKRKLFHLQQLFPWGCSLRIFWHHVKFHVGLHHRQWHRGDQSRGQGGALPWVNLITSSVWKPTDYNFHCCWNDHTWDKQRKVQSKLILLKGLFSYLEKNERQAECKWSEWFCTINTN